MAEHEMRESLEASPTDGFDTTIIVPTNERTVMISWEHAARLHDHLPFEPVGKLGEAKAALWDALHAAPVSKGQTAPEAEAISAQLLKLIPGRYEDVPEVEVAGWRVRCGIPAHGDPVWRADPLDNSDEPPHHVRCPLGPCDSPHTMAMAMVAINRLVSEGEKNA
jgi:hypothetical protein